MINAGRASPRLRISGRVRACAYERFIGDVCFDTPKPLASEKWVKWTIVMPSPEPKQSYTFNITAEPNAGMAVTPPVADKVPEAPPAPAVKEMRVKGTVTIKGMLAKKKVSRKGEQAEVTIRVTPGVENVELVLETALVKTCTLKVSPDPADKTLGVVAEQACAENPTITVAGAAKVMDKSMELTLKFKTPEGAVETVWELKQ